MVHLISAKRPDLEKKRPDLEKKRRDLEKKRKQTNKQKQNKKKTYRFVGFVIPADYWVKIKEKK